MAFRQMARRAISTIIDNAKVSESKAIGNNTKLQRAFFYVPASNQRFLQKALTTEADITVFDLEDGVASNAKEQARENLRDVLSKMKQKHIRSNGAPSELVVRINEVASDEIEHDLKALEGYTHLIDGICLPKTHSAYEIDALQARLVDCFGAEFANNVDFYPLIESAQGILELKNMFDDDDGQIKAVVFAAEDFCADMGIERGNNLDNMIYARSVIATTARAQEVGAIDAVCTDYKSTSQLEFECNNGRWLGFDGKQCVHPGQVETIQKLFSPSQKQVEKAQAIISARDENAEQGKGAFTVDGKMVDKPVWLAAEKVLAKAKLAGMI